MTGDVLRTDIEYAIRLLKANRSNQEAIAALGLRGVSAANAAQLVDDLRQGRRVTPEILSRIEFAPRRSSRSKPVAPTSMPTQPSVPVEEPRRRRRRAEAGDGKRKISVGLGFAAAILVCAGVGFGAWLVSNRVRNGGTEALLGHPTTKASARELASSAGSLPAAGGPVRDGKLATGELAGPIAGGSTTQLSGGSAPGNLVFALGPDGLSIGGKAVSRGSAVQTVSKVLGPPTRTSETGTPGTMIYAYDNHGVLIYWDKGAGKESIVLDCEANGGPNGTTARFTGSLRVEGQVIRPETDAATLAGMQKLGLNNPQPSGGIFSGKCNGIELAFAYLKTPQRLSLVEIDLK
jgi:hypothetical protein